MYQKFKKHTWSFVRRSTPGFGIFRSRQDGHLEHRLIGNTDVGSDFTMSVAGAEHFNQIAENKIQYV